MPNLERLLNTRQAAEALGVCTRTLEGCRTRGDGPAFLKIGRATRYRPGDLLDWLESRVRRSTSDSAEAAQ